jgi:hypothetical protein
MIMNKTSKFWKLFKKDDKPQKEKDVISTSSQSETGTVNIEKDCTTSEEESNLDSKEDKMNDNKARIYNLIIVDESGSMSHLRESTLSGINETISTIHSAQEEFAATQKHTLTLVTFDSGSNRPDVRTMIDNQPISEVKEFKDYMPNGCTPLYDAMGQSLTHLHDRIKDDKDATAVVTVLTDGLENASREWDAAGLRRLIEQLKSEGWSFAYMGSAHNVKEVTDLLSIENVVEFSHNNLGAGSTWGRERSSRRAYYEKMNRMYEEERSMSREEMLERKRQYAKEYYGPRVSNDRIDHLEENEIFVFGSNASGYHGGGAAAYAMRKFGAVWGQGEGLQGQSYAIPTMEGIAEMSEAIKRFTSFAAEHSELRFLVTRVGCGVAGYSASQIAPLFKECIPLENVALPSDFWDVLGLKMY